MVVPLTSNLKRARAIGNLLLRPEQSGLDRESVALVCQVITLDEEFFDERIGSLSSRVRAQLDRGMVIALGLRSAW